MTLAMSTCGAVTRTASACLANYTCAKIPDDAPDFRSPMVEASIPQNNSDLAAEKGPACDVRHRFAVSAVYDVPSGSEPLGVDERALPSDWQVSTVYQVQSGYPVHHLGVRRHRQLGTVLGENPIRANVTGEPIFGPGTHTATKWFNPAAFATPAAYTFGNAGQELQCTVLDWQTVDLALPATSSRLPSVPRFRFRG